MKLGIPKEVFPGERRVAATPDSAKRLQQLGFEVWLEAGAGLESNLADEAYAAAGVKIAPDARGLWETADIILKVRPPMDHPALGIHETELLRPDHILISFIYPGQNKELLDQIAARKATAFAMDCIPRVSRAQKMDALSSMANISGYRAVIEAASAFGRSFMGQVTAAGKLPPAKVLVIGAGVAGLAAIGVGRGLGAVVRAFDTRPAVKEQVQSLGAEFLELEFKEDGTGEGGYSKVMSEEFIKAEMALFAAQAKEVDIIITTALIPGRRAPILITADMVRSMREGSVIVDLASEQGGNCELTEPGSIVEKDGVTLIGLTDMPSRLPSTSSQLYGTNLYHLLDDLGGAKNFNINLEDEVIRGALVMHRGELMWPPPKPRPSAAPVAKAPEKAAAPAVVAPAPITSPVSSSPSSAPGGLTTATLGGLAAGALLFGVLGAFAPVAFLSHFTVFVLACFVGYQVVWNVTPALHTPLMSVTNAISGIIVLGGMLQLVKDASPLQQGIGAFAVLIASINIAGGFLVTQRMLNMFRK